MAYCQPLALSRARTMRKHLTHAEAILWTRLRGRQHAGWRFRKQHPIGPYIADFVCIPARLVIEIAGETHGSAEQVRHDERRDAYLQERGWRVFRVTNADVYQRLDTVLEEIALIAQGVMEPPARTP